MRLFRLPYKSAEMSRNIQQWQMTVDVFISPTLVSLASRTDPSRPSRRLILQLLIIITSNSIILNAWIYHMLNVVNNSWYFWLTLIPRYFFLMNSIEFNWILLDFWCVLKDLNRPWCHEFIISCLFLFFSLLARWYSNGKNFNNNKINNNNTKDTDSESGGHKVTENRQR